MKSLFIPHQLVLKMRRLKPTIYIDHLKKVLKGFPENERDELKHENIDEEFGLLELARNAGKMRNNNRGAVCSQYLQ